METSSIYPTSKIAMYNGLHSFYSLDSEVINGVLDLSLSDPTYLAFRVYFDLDAEGGLFGKDHDTGNKFGIQSNCALSYLKRIGDENRYQALKTLIDLLRAVQDNAHHCFTSIDGLQEMWTRNVNEILIKDKKINLTLTESVDWRMTTIASLIRYICYDYGRMVYVLPENLRMFNMVVYVTELRIFASPLDSSGNFDLSTAQYFGIAESSFGDNKIAVFNDPDTLNKFNAAAKNNLYKTPLFQNLNDKLWGVKSVNSTENASLKYVNPDDIGVYLTQGMYVMFGLGDCEFELETGSRFFESIDMASDPNMRSSNMSIKYGSLHIREKLPITGTFEETVVAQNDVYKAPKKSATTTKLEQKEVGLAPMKVGTLRQLGGGSILKTAIKSAVTKMAGEALDYAKQFAQATTLNLMTEAAMQASRNLVGKVVGNAYNFNAIDFLTMTNPQMAFMKVKQGIKKATTDNPATTAADSNRKAMSESPVYPEQSTKKQSLPVKNVYDKSQNSL